MPTFRDIYGDFCAHDNDNNDTIDYFTVCTCARDNIYHSHVGLD